MEPSERTAPLLFLIYPLTDPTTQLQEWLADLPLYIKGLFDG
ncbi:hypothetical protein [Cohnella silvisoli]|uniref:Uncharacterized protein n=1 Tax=Cohnella silvisoli TaxID=2873699 RepID=A0ABV1KNK0_9BACL|nr:hypothetical protein [Cohnella silvisoli]